MHINTKVSYIGGDTEVAKVETEVLGQNLIKNKSRKVTVRSTMEQANLNNNLFQLAIFNLQMARLLFIAPIVAIFALPVYFLVLKGPPPLPDIDYNEWWGPDSLMAKQDTSVKPFKISFAETVSSIDDFVVIRSKISPSSNLFNEIGRIKATILKTNIQNKSDTIKIFFIKRCTTAPFLITTGYSMI